MKIVIYFMQQPEMDFTYIIIKEKLKMKKNVIIIPLLFLLPIISFAQPIGKWSLVGSLPIAGSLLIVDSMTLICNTSCESSFFRSTDAGNSWKEIHPAATSPFNPDIIYKATSKDLFALQCSSNAIIHSSNLGDSWTDMYKLSTLKPGANYFGLTMWDADNGFLFFKDTNNVFEDMVTHDGCASFTYLGHDSLFQRISMQKNNFQFASMWLDSKNGLIWSPGFGKPPSKILVTHNGGIDWILAHILTPHGDTSVGLPNYGAGYSRFSDTYNFLSAKHDVFLYSSSDKGDHWNVSDTTSCPVKLAYITQATNSTLWASAWPTRDADPSLAKRKVIAYTSDLGKSWSVDRTSAENYDIGSIDFPDSLHGFAVGIKIDGTAGDFLLKFTPLNSGVERNEKKIDKSLDLFPNPCDRFIHIKSNRLNTSIRIVNLLGQEVLRSDSQEKSFDISYYPPGVYFLELFTPDGNIMRRSFLKTTP